MTGWSALDEAKHRAQARMRASADAFGHRARGFADKFFVDGSAALMGCRSETEVARVERDFAEAMNILLGAFDGHEP